ncbi:MAG: phage tail tape measure protein [Legionellales bacterium]|nr:phage tail tape measure protein [Legionellales bacterium]
MASTIAINITGNTADITAKLNQLNANLNRLQSNAARGAGGMGTLGTSFGSMIGKASALTAGFIGISQAIRLVTSSIGTIAKFQYTMSEVQAVSGATKQQFAAMSAEARKLGADTMFSASQAAEGLKFLSMAGFSAKDSTAALSDTLALAQAGSLGLGRAADIMSNIMSAYGIKATMAASVSDDMATTAANSNTNIEQLGDAMKYVGATAKAMGTPMSTSAAAIGVLSNAGMQGSMAGTGLRQVFIKLTQDSEKSRQVLAQMGLTMDMVNPEKVGLVPAMQRLSEAGMTGSEAIALFGARGAAAALNLTEGLPVMAELEEKLNNNDGAAKDMAGTMEDNLLGAFKILKSAFEELILSTGESGFAGGLKKGVKAITAFIQLLSGSLKPSNEFYKVAQRIKMWFDRLITVVKIFFAIWAANKLLGIFNSIGGGAVAMFRVIRGVMMGTQVAFRAGSVAAHGFKAALISTGVGALVVGLGLLIGMFMSMGDEAEAAAEHVKAAVEADMTAAGDKGTFKKPDDPEERGVVNANATFEDLMDVDEMVNLTELNANAQQAKNIQRSLASDLSRMKENARKGKWARADSHIWPEGAESRGQAIEMIEGRIAATKKLINSYTSAGVSRTIQAKMVAEEENTALQERLAILKQITEEINRGATQDKTRAGQIELMKLKLTDMREEADLLTSWSPAEGQSVEDAAKEQGRSVEDVEADQRKLKLLNEQIPLMQANLTMEEKILSAQRAGDGNLEKKLEKEKEIAVLKQKQAELEAKREGRDVAKASFEYTEAEEQMDEMTGKVKRRAEVQRIIDTDTTQDRKFTGAGMETGGQVGEGKYRSIEDDLRTSLLALKEAATDTSRHENDRSQARTSFEVLKSYLDAGGVDIDGKAKGLAGIQERDRAMREEGDDFRVQTRDEKNIMDFARSAVTASFGTQKGNQADRSELDLGKAIQANLAVALKGTAFEGQEENLITKTQDGSVIKETFNAVEAQKLLNTLKRDEKFLDEEQQSLAASLTARLGEQAVLREKIGKESQKAADAAEKELDAARKGLKVASESMEMRALKVMAGETDGAGNKTARAKAAEQELGNMEDAKAVTAHMDKFDKNIDKAVKASEIKDAQGNVIGQREGGMTKEEGDRRKKEERAKAEAIVAAEREAKNKKGGGKMGDGIGGISSLAKIGGGGGVGRGNPMVEAQNKGNALLQEMVNVLKGGVVVAPKEEKPVKLDAEGKPVKVAKVDEPPVKPEDLPLDANGDPVVNPALFEGVGEAVVKKEAVALDSLNKPEESAGAQEAVAKASETTAKKASGMLAVLERIDNKLDSGPNGDGPIFNIQNS